jgi:hypothetical protein
LGPVFGRGAANAIGCSSDETASSAAEADRISMCGQHGADLAHR